MNLFKFSADAGIYGPTPFKSSKGEDKDQQPSPTPESDEGTFLMQAYFLWANLSNDVKLLLRKIYMYTLLYRFKVI